MRHHPSATATTALSALIAALPVERLCEIVVALANGAAPAAVVNQEPVDESPATMRRRKPGRRPGRPRKVATMLAAEARAARNARQAERARQRRAVAKAAQEAAGESEATLAAAEDGNGAPANRVAKATRR